MSTPGPHIYTLTGNLLAEHTLTFNGWAPGGTHRATTESFQAGGKGINVSRMLVRLRTPTTALCFAGGASGEACTAWLAARGIDCRAYIAEKPTRTGIIVRAAGRPETTFFSPDADPDADAVRYCAGFLDSLPGGRALAICGSMPGWAGPAFDPLRGALERWLKRGTLVADTYGPPLAWLAERPLALVKVNATEFCALALGRVAPGVPGMTQDLLTDFAPTKPVHNWIVTSGDGPVWVRTENDAPISLAPPAVEEISPTGSGDVLLACVLEAWLHRGKSLSDAVASALPYAAANAAHSGVAEFPLPPG